MKQTGIKVITENRKARFDYFLHERFEAGLVLTGTEIKAIRAGAVNLSDSYVIIKNGEMFVLNMHIGEYSHGNLFNHECLRTRKLLLHRYEILKFITSAKKGAFTMIPTRLYLKNGRAKLEFALATGKKQVDKRATERQRSMDREARQNLGS